ncbi:MAG: hypothetical protein E7051_04090 [Lentisphaerae bacterium]|nr:hypothetical protein [Lentisphaerota bacterium]
MKKFIDAVAKNVRWFEKSGIMYPADGFWGVAERLVTLDIEDSVREEILQNFSSRTMLDGCFAVESRRPDCNFETALMFLIYGNIANDEKRKKTGENLLDYLFFRSAMRRSEKHVLPGAWRWSHAICTNGGHWFDDNSWCIIAEAAIAAKFPELDKKYNAGFWAEKLADPLHAALERTVTLEPDEKGEIHDPEELWIGNIRLPHWGGLTIFALSAVHAAKGRKKYLPAIKKYIARMMDELPGFSTSEYAYALMGATAVAAAYGDKTAGKAAKKACELLCSAADPETGTLPSSHYEAPAGQALADLIYTLNWSLLGLQMYCRLFPEEKDAAELLDKQLKLVVKIQDRSKSDHYRGCWRGMYDMETKSWGGGNRYEGGSSSIYSGWTNAPISLALLLQTQQSSLLELSGIL